MRLDFHEKKLKDYQNQTVNVRVLLPDSYDIETKSYPVVYIQDGQCVFQDKDLLRFPSWKRESMRFLEYYSDYKKYVPDFLLVAIDSLVDAKERTLAYSPRATKIIIDNNGEEEVFEGNGHLYVKWLVEELKPFIDQTYRTLPDCQNTAIGGFSSGASASLYAVLEYPQVFSRLFMYGAAVWLWDFYFREAIQKTTFHNLQYVYSLCGTNEVSRIGDADWTLNANREIFDLLVKRGVPISTARFYENIGGDHSIASWRPYFGDALRWIFQDK